MDFEKPPPKDTDQEKIEPNEEASGPDTNLPKPEQVQPYSDLTDDEKSRVTQEVIADLASHGQKIEDGQITFPTEKAKIESWVHEYSQHFESKRIVEVALNNPESAPKLTRELADRKEYSQLEQILQRYKGDPRFKYCVEEIEASLKGDEMQDTILMALSEAMTESEEEQRVAFEKFSEHMLNKPEKAARNLSTYFKLLKIDDEQAKELLDKKSLLLIGGGTAPIKDEFSGRGIDCEVTNIEPLLTEDAEGSSDHPIPENFYDVDLENMGGHDEIWSANNSLPTYAFNPEQVRTFYQKAIGNVNQGGYLRIVPVSGFSDAITPAMRLNRIPTSNESTRITELAKQRPDLFEIEDFKTPEVKSYFGKKKRMKGVNIKVVGEKEEIDTFLKELANEK